MLESANPHAGLLFSRFKLYRNLPAKQIPSFIPTPPFILSTNKREEPEPLRLFLFIYILSAKFLSLPTGLSHHRPWVLQLNSGQMKPYSLGKLLEEARAASGMC